MSVNSETNVTCKLCGTSQPFSTWPTVNVTLNPELKPKLLRGDLTRFVCAKCGWSGEVLYPLLYHDMTRHFMVWLWPKTDEPDMKGTPIEKLAPDYRFRIVPTRNDLIEKILVFEHNMDDRIVELVKLRLWAQAAEQGKPYPGLLLFSKNVKDAKGDEIMHFRHLKESEAESLSVPFTLYNQTRESVADKLPEPDSERGRWLRVEREYAKGLVSRGH